MPNKLRNVWDLSNEELAEMGRKSAAVSRAADLLVAPLFAEQGFLAEATEDELREYLPPEEVEYVLDTRRRDQDPDA